MEATAGSQSNTDPSEVAARIDVIWFSGRYLFISASWAKTQEGQVICSGSHHGAKLLAQDFPSSDIFAQIMGLPNEQAQFLRGLL